MTALQTRIIEFLKAEGIYATKGINAIYPDLIEESIYRAQELGIDNYLANTTSGAKIRNFVIQEVLDNANI